MKNKTNVLINEVLSIPFILSSLTKNLKNPKIKMEHSRLIVEPNVTQKIKGEDFDWAFYDNNISKLLEVCPNQTYCTKTSKFINMFSNIKKTKSQIMNHMKYISIYIYIYIYHKNLS